MFMREIQVKPDCICVDTAAGLILLPQDKYKRDKCVLVEVWGDMGKGNGFFVKLL